MQNIINNEISISGNVSWGIIGCGDVTEVKSGPAFNKVPGSSLVAVMRRDGARAKDYAQRHGVQYWFDDADALINHPEVNAIYVATPPKYHEAYTLAAINAGKPVYVEKPMSVDVASCMRMMEASANSGVKLTVAHYRRALPKFIQIKTMLDEQLIGDIRAINIRLLSNDTSAKTTSGWRVDPAIAGAGLFYDLAPHQLDLLYYYFGDTVAAYGFSANQAGLYAAEDIVTGIIQLDNNIMVSTTWCFTAAETVKEDIFEIIGSKGTIAFPVFGHTIYIETASGKEIISFDPPTHIQQPMIENVVQFFSGKGPNPCTAEAAIRSMKIMEQFVCGHSR